jgi:hypothetical protein
VHYDPARLALHLDNPRIGRKLESGHLSQRRTRRGTEFHRQTGNENRNSYDNQDAKAYHNRAQHAVTCTGSWIRLNV